MRKKTQDKFLNQSTLIHGNFYDYSKAIYINSKEKIIINCPIHGEFKQIPNDHIRGIGCPKCGIEKCNLSTVSNNEKFKRHARTIHGDKYDYSYVDYVTNKIKVQIYCPVSDHGIFNQTPNNHLKYGCPKCGNIKKGKTRLKSKDEFINQSEAIFGEIFDYSSTIYKGTSEHLLLKCKKHNLDFYQLPHNHLKGFYGCPKCNQTTSKFEISVFDFVKMGVKNKSILNGQEIDIFIPDKNLAIECNGNYWHSELQGKNNQYHLHKTIECEKQGITLLHIFESEWMYKKEIWKSIINSKLNKTNRIYARRCKIKEISNSIKNQFLNDNHLQGEDISSIKLGLYYADKLVSVMTFCKSRFNKKYEWELSRFSSLLNTTVVGGASKLLNYFIKNHNPNSIVSYSNRRYSNGNLYKQLGFRFLHNSSPNYFYFKVDKKYTLISRQQFQKHKLKNKLSLFDPDLSEWENMKLNGYDRIWDCGNGVWELIIT